MNCWHVNEDTFDAKTKNLRSQETVFTIGNGYFCTRGTFEEGYPRATPSTLLFGVFDDIPISEEELANAPDWTPLQLFVNGERFRIDRGTLLSYYRTLDIQNGVLRRSVHWESPGGVQLHVESERFASLADEHLGVIRYSVTIEESPNHQPVTVAIWASIDAAQGNYDVLHWETVDQGHQQNLLWLHSQTRHTLVQLAQTLSFTTSTPGFQKEIVDSDLAPSIRFYGTLTPGVTLTTEKLVVMYTSRDGVEPVNAALTHHQELLDQATRLPEPDIHSALKLDTISAEPVHACTQLYDQLLAQSSVAWKRFWDIADIVIEGDDKAQVSVRYNLYQLRINISPHDSRYNIAAKGLTGFGYRGHIFHDTEIFMLPFFIYEQPEIARNLLLYRYHLLDAARKKASSNGYRGAQYPWESTLSGEETTPTAIIHPETGELVPVLNGMIELHITASIAHAVWEYWRVSGDDEFMRDYGAELLLSTAMFWADRVEHNDERNDYEITNVIGPDEWHEHVNNNAYTNYMARSNIQYALYIFPWLLKNDPAKAEELADKLKLSAKTLNHWRDIIGHLRIPQDLPTRLFEQFDGFFQLDTLPQEKYHGRKDSYQGILGMEQVQKYRIIKQADVLMLLTVMLQDFDLQTKKVNWDYYYPITDHDYGSSLTPALHTILACELGLADVAYKQFMLGALVDLENLRGNTPEGIHAAGAGAVWQAMILGFAGLRVTDNGYTTRPTWPDNWQRLTFNFYYKGQLQHVDLHRQ
ncbi:MAG TPA: glycosyl hydrolase family 65 protein [Ktedonobacteraceae bacterium]|nr:glycosyl hydrolase family 65 protein [Ktedonobacteraceae bacterium]